MIVYPLSLDRAESSHLLAAKVSQHQANEREWKEAEDDTSSKDSNLCP